MDIAMVGLGVMGRNLVLNMADHGFAVTGYDRDASKVEALRKEGQGKKVEAVADANELVAKLKKPRAVMMLVPAGAPVDSVIRDLLPRLQPGDLIVDGGNSHFTDTNLRTKAVAEKKIEFIGVGISGGERGARFGPSMMPGGSKQAYERVRPIFEACAAKVQGEPCVTYLGSGSAGHYVKMVHNGIEYGLLQAYGEGFEILEKSQFKYDLHQLAKLWLTGSVVRSWLLELLEAALRDDPTLADIKGFVVDSGEGRWTVQAAIDEDVPAPVITLSLLARFASRQDESFSAKIIAALRNQFGGHAVMHDVHEAPPRDNGVAAAKV